MAKSKGKSSIKGAVAFVTRGPYAGKMTMKVANSVMPPTREQLLKRWEAEGNLSST
jgi:hypothetical protein